jgi:cytoskeletal protein CcmA (bactofilin family)
MTMKTAVLVSFLSTLCACGTPDTQADGGRAGGGSGGSAGGGNGTGGGAVELAPTVTGTRPSSNATNVPLNARVSATFSVAMALASLSQSSFTLSQGTTKVPGTVDFSGQSATFTPGSNLVAGLVYTATVSTDARSLAGRALTAPYSWSFTAGTSTAVGPAPVGLGASGDFVVLAKTGISTVPASVVTGNIGLSPAAATFVTGFSLVADATNTFSTSTQVTGKVFAATDAPPTSSTLTSAVGNMEGAYTDAASRPTPDFLELGSGDLGGKTLAPGLYKWTSTLTIPGSVTFQGGVNDTWILQTSGDVSMAAARNVILAGGAQAKNIVWQVAGKVTVGAGAHFEGVILCKTQVTLETGATMNGRVLAQSQVALQQATVTQPAP